MLPVRCSLLLCLITFVLTNINLTPNIDVNNLESCINEIQTNFTSNDFLIYINLNEKFRDLKLHQPVILQNKLTDLKYFQTFKATFYVLILTEDNFEDVFTFLIISYSWNPRAKFLVILEKPFENLFVIAQKYYVFNIIMLIPNDDCIQLITYYTFKSAATAEINTCINGRLQNTASLFPNKLPVDFQNTSVRTIYMTYPPYVIKNNNLMYGMEVNVLKMMQQVLNINIIYENKPFQNWGRRLKNGSYEGAYSYLRNYQADLAIGLFYANRNEYRDFDQTYPYMEDNAKWVVPIAKREEIWRVVINTYKVYVWIFFIISFFIVLFSLHSIALTSSKSSLYKKKMHCLIVCYKCFLGQSIDLPTPSSLRLTLGIWMYAGIIFTSVFQGKLFSNLNTKVMKKQISDVQELIDSKIQFGFYNDSRYLFINSNNKLDEYIYNNYVTCPIDFHCLNRTAFQGDFATFKPKKFIEYMISSRYLDKRGNSLLYMFNTNIYNVLVTLAFAKGFPLFNKVNTLLFHMRSAGFIDLYYKQASFYAQKAIREAQNKRFSSQALAMHHVFWIFWILLFGLGFALLVLVGEMLFYKWTIKKTHFYMQ
ncbi:hypothetical protein RN001_007997 [Aquatica leii]|uniref:Ionotropic glutamate receptor C-terminal domain-containing protein n=1 Tax=Aquatica leii TaxID=1421715 RepID=A0AAN7PCR7_9COLE|nr:hypothetical protein RN001_007997 [Aquatica leii]